MMRFIVAGTFLTLFAGAIFGPDPICYLCVFLVMLITFLLLQALPPSDDIEDNV